MSTAGTEQVERSDREVAIVIRSETIDQRPDEKEWKSATRRERKNLPNPASSDDHSTFLTIVVRCLFDTFTTATASGVENDGIL